MNKSTLKFDLNDSSAETVTSASSGVNETGKKVYKVVAAYLEDNGIGYKTGDNVPLSADAASFHLANGSVKEA